LSAVAWRISTSLTTKVADIRLGIDQDVSAPAGGDVRVARSAVMQSIDTCCKMRVESSVAVGAATTGRVEPRPINVNVFPAAIVTEEKSNVASPSNATSIDEAAGVVTRPYAMWPSTLTGHMRRLSVIVTALRATSAAAVVNKSNESCTLSRRTLTGDSKLIPMTEMLSSDNASF